ncbi:MAG TPA: type II CAAX endopeptidase family protein [Symbiobacteriaceae bacterium]|jgi:uncharacterized protein|nr:type II CAAX endopeptidase family protein [Symbiobacteriaceae bacterium]
MTYIFWYLVVTFGFSFGVHGLFVLLRLPFEHPLAKTLYVVGMLGPLLGAVSVSAWRYGGWGVYDLLVGGLNWRFGIQWYLLAAGLMPVFYFGGLGLYRLFGGEFSGPLFKVSAWGFLGILALQIYTQIAEEYGWRGFLQPLMDQYLGGLAAALVVGIVWAAWHLPMFWVPGSNQTGSFWDFAFWLICWSVMMSAMRHQTGGSTIPAMIFHMSLNACYFAIRVPPGAKPYVLALEVAGALAATPFLPRPIFYFF